MTSIQTNTVDPSLLTTMNGASSGKSSVQDAQDRFMTLLVTQMKNQDPLNPMDNAQVTSQMAQLSTVTGIDKLNASVNALNANFLASQNLQAAGMIGHGVLTPGQALTLSDGKSVYAVDLPQAADKASVVIKDANGLVVRTMDLGALSSGTNNLTWDGKTDSGATAANGNYTYTLTASAQGKQIDATQLAFGMVTSVSSGTQGMKLNVSGIGQIGMSDIHQIY
ncbi:flagellar hook assembly protein FlgD [Undibacterium oligocarboniphilum]|uniref:Basal-body rod modification protein FlgD n=1 Tax=Undibacterium oligocarboniphilum TaxID=666702 RepID=A0A850QN53_9BURK|nr:flagellar hook assembly protein FlgD [Undibacterium oligocarboniphilum]MBC3870149.1 flagellar hook assembly protein FlgD [Undibacterium oligocarboniphilum]NVO78140.1 flagellar hook assembly protein FlgD [Undibacterium oligocarboniphilum]